MTINDSLESRKSPSLGIHYYADTLHYREKDLQLWVPQMVNIGISSIVLLSPLQRAIPEGFIRGLIEAGITPIIHLKSSLPNTMDVDTLNLLFNNYARWGAKYVIIFDRPNDRSSWHPTTWLQKDLIERFTEEFLLIAKTMLRYDLIPVFPPLEPGGSYWDTAFLRSTLEGLKRRNESGLLEKLVISSYVWHWNRSLNWGAGGPMRWAGAKPYFTPENEQDQRGFRIFEWYDAICNAVFGRSFPQIALGAGCPMNPGELREEKDVEKLSLHTNRLFDLYRLVMEDEVIDSYSHNKLSGFPKYISSVNFYNLTAVAESKEAWLAWFDEDGQEREIVKRIRAYQPMPKTMEEGMKQLKQEEDVPSSIRDLALVSHPIKHYVLLPTYSWGISDWHLDVIRPFVKKHSVTVGFSVEEAMFAQKVTVIGNEQVFSDQYLTKLRQSGCEVERIDGDGTTIASILSMR